MDRHDCPEARRLRGCGRWADVTAARGGWGMTARYCFIGAARTAVPSVVVALAAAQSTGLLGLR